MKRIMLLTGIAVVTLSCNSSNQPDTSSEKSVEEIKSQGPISNADIIRSPVTADEPIDTVNVAKIEFEETSFDFGEVKEGAIVEHSFSFTNTGKAPLLINNARSTCGCTIPDWPKEPIPPGEKGEISVRFDTHNKHNQQSKPITVTANTYPATSRVFLSGFVHPADGGKASTE
ncbi:MAG: DUF1573 domain-containing protein [Phaeodactylibacter sp.]|nr:DUF1573 domain-containing protein [Phaeodactylibacter sp.]MCB9303453.1 DUF1573 domain-containing protein [Lewinellaceae bacterium]